MQKEFRVVSLNAQSLVNKVTELKALLLEPNPHNVLVTEMWLHSGISNSEIIPPSYRCLRNDRSSRAGGVAVIIKSDIHVVTLPPIPQNEFVL